MTTTPTAATPITQPQQQPALAYPTSDMDTRANTPFTTAKDLYYRLRIGEFAMGSEASVRTRFAMATNAAAAPTQYDACASSSVAMHTIMTPGALHRHPELYQKLCCVSAGFRDAHMAAVGAAGVDVVSNGDYAHTCGDIAVFTWLFRFIARNLGIEVRTDEVPNPCVNGTSMADFSTPPAGMAAAVMTAALTRARTTGLHVHRVSLAGDASSNWVDVCDGDDSIELADAADKAGLLGALAVGLACRGMADTAVDIFVALFNRCVVTRSDIAARSARVAATLGEAIASGGDDANTDTECVLCSVADVMATDVARFPWGRVFQSIASALVPRPGCKKSSDLTQARAWEYRRPTRCRVAIAMRNVLCMSEDTCDTIRAQVQLVARWTVMCVCGSEWLRIPLVVNGVRMHCICCAHHALGNVVNAYSNPPLRYCYAGLWPDDGTQDIV